MADADARVRIQGVRGLVSLDDTEGVAAAAADEVREVRVVVAHGLGTIGRPASATTLERLAGDADLLVRAAALEATAGLGGADGCGRSPRRRSRTRPGRSGSVPREAWRRHPTRWRSRRC